MRRLLPVAAVMAALPAGAVAKDRDHVRGCNSDSCDDRIGARWAARHPKARIASFTAPYRAWLNKVAMCESTNNTRAVSPDGKYRGLFQFDLQTWWSVGGKGDPIDASRAEQEFRAVVLLKRRGTSPWPVCG